MKELTIKTEWENCLPENNLPVPSAVQEANMKYSKSKGKSKLSHNTALQDTSLWCQMKLLKCPAPDLEVTKHAAVETLHTVISINFRI